MGSKEEEDAGVALLGELIDSINHLSRRVKILQESQVVEQPSDNPLPEVEVKVYNQNMLLLKLHCMKRKTVLVKVLSELDNFNLTVVSVNVAPFGGSLLHITIVAEMSQDLVNVHQPQDIAAALQSVLREDS